MMAVNYATLATTLETRLNQVDASLLLISNVQNKLPVINKQLIDVDPVRNAVKDFRSTLVDSFKALSTPTSVQFQNAVFGALGPAGLNVLADRAGDTTDPGTVTRDDVVLPVFTPDAVTVKLNLHKAVPTAIDTDFGIGLGGVPLRVEANGNARVSVDYSYDDLTFGWSGGAPFFSSDAVDEFRIGLSASVRPLPDPAKPSDPTPVLKGNLGFLKFSATDTNPSPELTGSLVADVRTVGSSVSLAAPKLTASADIKLHLDATLDSPTPRKFPSISSDFRLQWTFGNVNPAGARADFGGDPQVSFDNVRMNLGSFFNDLVGPMVDDIQKITHPLQPIVDVLKTEVPVISGLSKTAGLGPVTILSLAGMASSVDALPPDVKLYVQLATQIAKAVDDINMVRVDPGVNSYFINFGSFDLSKNGDLKTLGDVVYNAASATWTSLVTNYSGSVDFEKIKKGIGDTLGPAVGGLVNGVLDRFHVTDAAKDNGVKLSFPLLDDPTACIFKVMLGQDTDLVSFTAKLQNVPANETRDLPAAGIDAHFVADVHPDGFFKIAYDTYGLRRFAASLPSVDFSLIGQGLYVDTSSHLNLTGTIGVSVGAGVSVFSVALDGGVTASVNLSLDLSASDGDSKLRPFTELGGSIFNVSGSVEAYLNLLVRIGVKAPVVGFIGVEKSLTLAKETLVSFASGSKVPNPFLPPPALVLAAVDPTTGDLTLNMGPRALLRLYETGVIDENFNVTHAGGSAGNETVAVTAFGFTQEYSGVRRVVAFGGDGRDVITTGAELVSPVALYGGDGNDAITHIGSGAAALYGEGGDDTISGGGGTNVISGGDGSDTLTGGTTPGVPSELHGEGGDDRLVGRAGANQLFGDGGADVLAAGPAGDLLVGGEGDDHLASGAGNDRLVGGAGNDVFTYRLGDGNDLVDGGTGIDSLGIDTAAAADLVVVRKSAGSILATVGTAEITVLDNPGPPEQSSATEFIGINAAGGADSVIIDELTSTGVTNVTINVGDVASPDGAPDAVRVLGTTTADNLLVQNEVVELDPQGIATGGVMKITGLPSYTVRTVNVADDLAVVTLDGDDAVRVYGDTGPTRVVTAGGDDAVVAGNAADRLDEIVAPLGVDAGIGADSLIARDGGSTAGFPYSVTEDAIDRGPLHVATYGGVESLLLRTSAGNDDVRVTSTGPGTQTEISGSGGRDRVTVGASADGAQSIRGPVRVTNPPAFTDLVIDDSANVAAVNALVGAASVTGLAPAPVSFEPNDLASLSVLGGPGGNVFTVDGTPGNPSLAALPTTLATGAGADQVWVYATDSRGLLNVDGAGGADAVTIGLAGSVQLVAGPVFVNNSAPGGYTRLVLDDSADVFGRTVGVGGGAVTGLAPAAIRYSISDLSELDVRTGSGNDAVVLSAPGMYRPVRLALGAGNDTLRVGDGVSVGGFSGTSALDGGTGADYVDFDDTLDSANVAHTLTPTSYTRSGFGTFAYAGFEQLAVHGGSGADDFRVTPSADTEFQVHGAAPLSAPGDRLAVVLAGTTDPVRTPSSATDGVYTFGNRRPLTYTGIEQFPPVAAVTGRYVTYRGALGGSPAADKSALMPGATATFANYTSYSLGINGVTIDVAGLPADLGDGDFRFRVGDDNNPGAWADVASPAVIAVHRGMGSGGSDRVEITWRDGAIRNTWLEVTLKADSDTGLAAPDVFYFGNVIGDTGDSAAGARVTTSDVLAVRSHQLPGGSPATSPYDINRDGRVNLLDVLLARRNLFHGINLITPAAAPQPPANAAAAAAAPLGMVSATRRGAPARMSMQLLDGAGEAN